jgi:hypothetical protein
VELAEVATTSDPELVVVFELAGAVEGFLRAVRDIDGLEFLADIAAEGVEPDDDFYVERQGVRTDELVPQSLYLLMTNAAAVDELISLFAQWQADPTIRFATGLAPLKRVFSYLRTLRRWGPEDRVIETGLLEQWREEVDVVGPNSFARVEIELWFRSNPAVRATAEQQVVDLVVASGGRHITSSTVDFIGYRAILADLPHSQVETVLRDGPQAIQLLANSSVMFVSPSRPMSFEVEENDGGELTSSGPLPSGQPRIALLDGLPISNHALLADRLVVDDPDDIGSLYEHRFQVHGTSMASLLIHGDLSAPGPPLTSPVYVRPVLQPHEFARAEITAPNGLFVDLIHRCFRRMLEGDGGNAATAPSVRIVNLSVGDPVRLFARHLSPLAKLLDWCAHQYNLVVIVSAGNYRGPVEVTSEHLLTGGEQAREEFARYNHERSMHRRMISPAEAVNALTIGATHEDSVIVDLPDSIVNLVGEGLPAGYSPVGFGFRRSVKPEILFPGGRQVHVRPPPGATGPLVIEPAPATATGPGLRAASPGTTGDLRSTSYSVGTSNAAALASRNASSVFDILESMRGMAGSHQFPDAQYDPVLTKALLVHAARWGSRSSELESLLGLTGSNKRRQLTQILGYGPVELDRIASGDRVRATILGAGSITEGGRHTYRYPLPPSLSRTTVWRRLTLTLAWLSPINTLSRKHRMARLWIVPPTDPLGVARTEADHNAVTNGTVQHEVLEGSSAVAFIEGDTMSIEVDCRVDAGRLESPVRYALVASIEVAEDIGVDIHSEVQSALQVAAQQRIRPS